MADVTAVKAVAKKRESKAGHKRVTVSIPDAQYQELVKLAGEQMREPNNFLSFLLKDRLAVMLSDYAEE